jgi:acetoacetate decarboxylase
MTTLSQMANTEEVWSLERDRGALFIHYLADEDSARTVIPMPLEVLEHMAMRARESMPIIDRRQNVIEFRRCA